MSENTKYNLQDKVALVTGSAGGIGKAIAALFCANGAKVVISDFQEEAGRQDRSGSRRQIHPMRHQQDRAGQLAG